MLLLINPATTEVHDSQTVGSLNSEVQPLTVVYIAASLNAAVEVDTCETSMQVI